MKNFSFVVPPTFNHIFVDYSGESPKYYKDKDLKERIPIDGDVVEIKTLLPREVFKIEMSKVLQSFDSAAATIDYFHLWPFSHMKQADIIIDSQNHSLFSLYSDAQKTNYRESMEKVSWEHSLFIVYTKEDKSKIGFLLFR